jgi:hypothetical protein
VDDGGGEIMTEVVTADGVTEAYKACFATRAGKIVLENLKQYTNVYWGHLPNEGPIDTNRVIADEGRRSLVLWIMKKAGVLDDLMEKELR